MLEMVSFIEHWNTDHSFEEISCLFDSFDVHLALSKAENVSFMDRIVLLLIRILQSLYLLLH
jgi:hypothetical protein